MRSSLASRLAALALLVVPFAASAAPSAPRTRPAAPPVASRLVEVTTARVHLHDLGIGGAGVTDVDLGAAPPLGSTRTIDGAEIARALAAAHAPGSIKAPTLVRVVRKGRRLAPADVEGIVREAIDPARLPRGASIASVRASNVEVPDGYDRVTAELPAPPRRAGSVVVTAAVTFFSEGDVAARITVPLEINMPAEALVPDVAKGAAITLVVRRGLVEVSIVGTAATDGDTGGVLPVLLKPSGRIVRARIVDKDHAVSIEDS